jgi:hypothetical protein
MCVNHEVVHTLLIRGLPFVAGPGQSPGMVSPPLALGRIFEDYDVVHHRSFTEFADRRNFECEHQDVEEVNAY